MVVDATEANEGRVGGGSTTSRSARIGLRIPSGSHSGRHGTNRATGVSRSQTATGWPAPTTHRYSLNRAFSSLTLLAQRARRRAARCQRARRRWPRATAERILTR